MLQQTTVQAVAEYYRKFLARWPRVEDLAGAALDDILAAWAGLGYYARARNLHKAAKVVAHEMGGRFPDTVEGLRALPGVGPYTAGAIAAIAFDRSEAAMDANAERVVARLFAFDTPLPAGKPQLRKLGQSIVPEKRAGDFAQALMDLGSAICTVKRPACARCPLEKMCEGRRRGTAEALPAKSPKAERPLKRGAAFVVRNADGAVLLVKRPEKGLLGGMLEPPLGSWTAAFPSKEEAMGQAPFKAAWKKLPGIVRHGFTHFELEIEVWTTDVKKFHAETRRRGASHAILDGDADEAGRHSLRDSASPREITPIWVPIEKLGSVALPTVMRKIIAHAIPDEGPLFAVRRR
jgi:A/G-specific adenine glycosylase